MANKKISNLDALGGTPAVGDLLPVVDISDTTQGLAGSTKKMTVAELGAAITPDFSAIAEDIVPDADSTRDLGTTAKRWAEIWGDNIEATTDITIGGVASTGTGGLARATSPTFVTPTLGVASATSINLGDEALSTYDVGTFTPTFLGSGTAGTPTGTFTGNYIKVGQVVTVWVKAIFTGLDTMSTDLRMNGLPFTSSGTDFRGGLVPGFRNSFTTDYTISGFISGTQIRFYRADQDNVELAIADLSATTNLYFSMVYHTATT